MNKRLDLSVECNGEHLLWHDCFWSRVRLVPPACHPLSRHRVTIPALLLVRVDSIIPALSSQEDRDMIRRADGYDQAGDENFRVTSVPIRRQERDRVICDGTSTSSPPLPPRSSPDHQRPARHYDFSG